MKIFFWSIGKADEAYLQEGIELFTKRISHYYSVEWKIFPTAGKGTGGGPEASRKAEATAVLKALQKDDCIVTLDENGKQWSSVELADFIQRRANESIKNLIFIIGGSYGLHEDILKKASYCWSLSKLVFPHQLVRIILAEQVYRACTINRNEKYHHS